MDPIRERLITLQERIMDLDIKVETIKDNADKVKQVFKTSNFDTAFASFNLNLQIH